MSFAVAANGALSTASQVNQFQTTFTGGTISSVPNILGSASLVPLAITLGPSAGPDGLQGFISGASSYAAYSLGYAAGSGGNGAGYIGLGDGANNWAMMRATTSGLQTDSHLNVGNNVWVNNNLTTGSMVVSGNMNINATTWTVPANSTYNIDQLGAGAWWLTDDPAWAIGLGDDGGTGTAPGGSTYFHTIATGGGSTQHELQIYNRNGATGANNFIFSAQGNGNLNVGNGIGLLVNGFSRVAYMSGTGTGVFSHGLGVAPSWMIGSVTGTGGSGADCLNWVGNGSTFSMSAGSHTWVAIAWAN